MSLKINDLTAGYGRTDVLQGVSLHVDKDDYVAVVGANGVGKSTLLKAISGTSQVRGGSITFEGTDLTRLAAHEVPRLGIAHVPEGRQVFPALSVLDNLLMGAWLVRDKGLRDETLEGVFSVFPRLKERVAQAAGTLSGGEQQMVAVGRALMLRPKLIMLDEPSQGLSPRLVGEMYRQLAEVHSLGASVLLVEQNTTVALKFSARAYVMEHGRIAMSGSSEKLRGSEEVRKAYLGI